MSILRCAAAVAMTALLVGCDDSTSPSGQTVTVRFAVTGSNANLAVAGGAAQVSTQALSVSGSNGTLEIDRIAFIVSRVEFEQQDDACEVSGNNSGEGSQGDNEDDDCEEFRFAPSFLDLPLPGGEVAVATGEVPPGSWTKLTFRVKNIDFDDDDDDDADDDDDNVEDAALDALLVTARAAFPAWPRKASLVVTGSFTPTGATQKIPFTTFFNAEIKVKMPLQPPLQVTDAGASRDVVVELDPSRWFKSPDGSVADLSASDFSTTQRLVDLRVRMRDGFLQVRFD